MPTGTSFVLSDRVDEDRDRDGDQELRRGHRVEARAVAKVGASTSTYTAPTDATAVTIPFGRHRGVWVSSVMSAATSNPVIVYSADRGPVEHVDRRTAPLQPVLFWKSVNTTRRSRLSGSITRNTHGTADADEVPPTLMSLAGR